MDFERISGRELAQQASGDAGQAVNSQEAQAALAALQQAAMAPGGLRLVPGPDGIVALPDGTSLDQISVSGRDLVVQLPDGSQMIIVDGAVFVPQIVIGGIEIPPLNLAALLVGDEPQPAAGPPQSSGGNFEAPAGAISDPFGLGDLLPPTELAFTQYEEREIFPAQPDREPTNLIVTPDNTAGAVVASASVNEAGLPARGGEPAGSNASASSETTTGSIVFTAPDGLGSVAIGGTPVTGVGQTFTGPFGTLTITAIGEGRIDYSYTLTDNLLTGSPAGTFTVTVTDVDGDVATGTLTINVIDDAPVARADTDAVAAGTYGPEAGNVFTGTGTTSGAPGADTPGADGATVTGVQVGNGAFAAVTAAGVTINGQYGVLTLKADGSYSYVRNPGTPGGVSDVFNYRITDGDGDTSTTTLTIAIGDSGVTITPGPGLTTIGSDVSEAGLPARGGESEGSAATTNVETNTGAMTLTVPDGAASVTINGTAITAIGQVIITSKGALTITSVSPGTIEYSYTLSDNTSGDITADIFTVTVVDNDGDSLTLPLVINIADDAPTARNDSDSLAGGAFGPETGNVITGTGTTSGAAGADTQGADGATVTAIGNGATSVAAGTAIAGQYGTLTLNGDGSYSYVRNPGTPGGVTDSFGYTLTDGDGDMSSATLDIVIGDGTPSTNVPAAGGETTTVHEAGLPARGGESEGSDAAANSEQVSGTIGFTSPDGLGSVSLGGTVITPGSLPQTVFSDATGTLVVASLSYDAATGTGSIGYTYSLADNTLVDPSGVSFALVVIDADGDTATDSLDVRVIDDAPTARDDADSVTEDGPVVADGNVLTGNGGADVNASDGVADVQGADSAVVTTTGTIPGQYGTLVLGADGNYVYTLNNASQAVQGLSAGETLTESFDYVIEDGDGDTAGATLVITINGADDGVVINGLNVEGGEVVVNEDDLADGSSPDVAALTQGGSFTIDTPDGLDDVTIGGAVVVVGGVFTAQTVTTATGTLSVIAFTPVTGADGSVIGGTFTYSYVLSDNTLTHALPGEDSIAESFAVVVTDGDGSSANASLDVRVIDDVPIARNDASVAIAEDAVGTVGGNVLTNDTAGADGATLTAVTIDGITTAIAAAGTTNVTTANGIYAFQASGAWTFDPNPGLNNASGVDASFSYVITDGDGDQADATQPVTVIDGRVPVAGAPIILTLDDQNLANGSTPAGPDSVTANIAFTPGSDAIASIVFAADLTGLVGGLSWTRVSDTQIVGKDGATTIVTLDLVRVGDTAQVTATLGDNYDSHPGINLDDLVDLGSVGVVATDIDGDAATGTVNVAVSDDLPVISATGSTPRLIVDETGLGVDPSTSFAGAFASSFGADGPGSLSYALGFNAGSTGLVDTATGQAVVLSLESGQVIGRAGAGGPIVFTVTIDGSGTITLDQQRAVIHPDPHNPDERITLAATHLVTLTATITDGDGDSASSTINIGQRLVFDDDAPAIDARATDNNSVLLTTQDADTIGVAIDTDISTADFGGTFTVASTGFGADGAGLIAWTYALSLTGGPVSGLTSNGVGVNLFWISGQVFGSTATDAAAVSSDNIIFTLAVNGSTGVVTLTQCAEIDHAANGDGSAPYDDQFAVLANNLVQLTGTATITDGDGDLAFDTVSIDLGGNVRFADDGPSVTPSGATPRLIVDDLSLGVDPSTSFAGAFTVNHGADGAGTVSYALGFNAGSTGLVDTTTGQAVVLSLEAGQVVGRAGAGGLVVFVVSVDASGNVTLDQQRAVVHPDPTNPDERITLAATNLVTLTATATDGDGDSAATTINIGQRLIFDDDAPSASANAAVQLDDDALSGGNPGGTGDVTPDTANVAGTLGHNFGADGGSIAFLTTGFPAGFTYQLAGSNLEIFQGATKVITVTLDPATGAYTVIQNAAVRHPAGGNENDVSFTLNYKVTDGDGDTANGTLVINVDDDTPAARADVDSVTEDGPLAADGNVLTGTGGSDTNATDGVADTLGADGGSVTGIAFGATSGSVGSPLAGAYGSLTLGANGGYSYTLSNGMPAVQALNAGETLTETFTYTLTDGDGDTATATLTITINGANDGPIVGVGAATVSEEGLTGGIPDSSGSPSDTTNSTTANGTISVFDPDGDPLTVTLGNPGAVLTVGGASVTWAGVGTQTLTGSVGGNPVITITINNAGVYTVTLSDAVDHATINAEDLKTFVVPVSVSDGASNSGTTLTITIEDDSPTITGTAAIPTLTVDETTLAANASTSFAGAFTGVYGADGAGSTSYALGINAGVTGIVDTATGEAVVLRLNGSVVEGYLASSPATVVFTVSVNAAGNVTLDQIRAVAHGNTASANEAEALDFANRITLTATIKDVDNDTSSATINIGDKLAFLDDGPTAAISAAGLAISHDETPGVDSDAQDVTGPLTAFAGVSNPGDDPHVAGTVIGYARDASALSSGGSSTGADGGTIAFSLSVSSAGVDSGLDTTDGQNVLLYKEGSLIVGRVASQAGAAAFAIAVDPTTGAVEMVQYLSIRHPTGGASHDEPLSIVAAAVRATVTVTDGDNDVATSSVNIGDRISFQDDGPTISVAAGSTVLTVDESLGTAGSMQHEGGTANNDETVAGAAPGAIGFAQGAVAGLVNVNAGADGQASLSYALSITNSDSGLQDAATNQNIVLSLNNGVIEGRTASGNALVFTVEANSATGTVKLNQFRSIEHNDPANHDENGASAAEMLAGRIALNVTVADGDGDTASSAVDISRNFKFEDDGPGATSNTATAAETSVNFNSCFIVDFSGSISNAELNTQLDAIRDAGAALFDNTSGSVSIRIIGFATTASDLGVYTTKQAFINAVNGYNPGESGGARPMDGSTNFTAALDLAMQNFTPNLNANNQIFFLSDGNPNEPNGASVSNPIVGGTAAAWNTFVDTNFLNVTAIGVGDGIQNGPLQAVDVDGQGAPIMVAQFDELIDALLASILPPPVAGNVLTNGVPDDFGTDGGMIRSITVGGKTYTWDPANNEIDVSGGGSIAGSNLTNVVTAMGGKFSFAFVTGGGKTAGDWSYVAPADITGPSESFTYTLVDNDGDTSSAALTITLVENDAPVTSASSISVSEEGLSGSLPDSAGSPDTTHLAVRSGTVNFTDPDGDALTITLGAPVTSLTSGGAAVTWSGVGTQLLTGSAGGNPVITVAINNAGAYTVTLLKPVNQPNAAIEDAINLVVPVKASDGNATTTSKITISIEDDMPITFAPTETALPNTGVADTLASPASLGLAGKLGSDGLGSVVFVDDFAADNLLRNASGTLVTSGGQSVTLTGYGTSQLTGTIMDGGGNAVTVMTVSLNAAANSYSVDFNRPLDDGASVSLANLGFATAGNKSFNYIDVAGTAEDLLFSSYGRSAGNIVSIDTVNTNSTAIGVGNQSMNDGDNLRIDFVNSPSVSGSSSNTYDLGAHYNINSFTFGIVQKGGGTGTDAIEVWVRIYDADNTDPSGSNAAHFNELADDPQLAITGISVNGVTLGLASLQNDGNGGYLVTGLDLNDKVTVSRTGGYDRIEIENARSMTANPNAALNGDSFDIGAFTFTKTITGSDINLAFDLKLTDADGDSITVADALKIKATVAAPPVVFDLDGDGVEFVDRSAGVAFDYNGDGVRESTAWAGRDDGILALDRNGDGVANNGAEIVFGGNGLTDLQGLAADFDSNGDGILDASDIDFTKFGIWQDANGNGVSDAGEFASLPDMGIASLKLISDGVINTAANDDVVVHGETVFTRTDGSTGIAADASFATGGARVDEASRQGAANGTAGMANALVAASLVAAAVVTPETGKADPVTAGDTAMPVAENDQSFADDAAKSAPQGETIQPLAFDTHTPAPTISQHADRASDHEGDRGGHEARLTDDGPAYHASTPLLADSDVVVADIAAHSAPLFVDMVAMPAIPAAMAPVAEAAAAPQGEALASVIADALGGGSEAGPDIDALLAAATGHGGDAAGLLAAMGGNDATAFAGGMAAGHGMDLAMMSHDAVLAVNHA